MDNDRIKRRIRAMLNLANDSAAADGEIDNAMRFAAQLMNEHHVSAEDLAAEAAVNGAPPADPDMGQADGLCGTARLATWESVLGAAIVRLVGSIKCYQTSVLAKPSGGSVFSSASESRKALRFYGPTEDATLAAELFDEWRQTIGAMAVGRYGGCYRGDGAMYAYGFACRLSERAGEAERERRTIPAGSNAIVLASGKSLAEALAHKQALAAKWLAGQGVNLGSAGRRSGYSAGSLSAREAGRADAGRADFSATRRRKLTA